MDNKPIVVLLALWMLLSGCTGNDTLEAMLSTPPQRPTESSEPDVLRFESEVLAGMNRERQQRGLPALEPDERLTAVARAHSEDMAQGDFFDHVGTDGSRTGERLSAQGYRWSFYAENIACGQRSADEALKSWIESKPHRDNILSAKAQHAGVGVAFREASRCTFFWTAVFAAPN